MPKPLRELIKVERGEVVIRLSPWQCLKVGLGLRNAALVQSALAEEWEAFAMIFYSAGQACSVLGGLPETQRQNAVNFWAALEAETVGEKRSGASRITEDLCSDNSP